MPTSIARVSRALIVLMLGAASFAALAQIHRCKDEKGQTILSDRPCGADNAAQDSPRGSVGVVADRIAAPQMVSARTRDLTGQYDFIPDRGARPAAREQQGK